MIKRLKEYLRLRRVGRAIRILKRDGQPELEKVLRDKAAEMAIPLSIHQTHQIIEQQGLAHCYACPKRFSLRKIRPGLYACDTHYKFWQSKQAEEAKVVANA